MALNSSAAFLTPSEEVSCIVVVKDGHVRARRSCRDSLRLSGIAAETKANKLPS